MAKRKSLFKKIRCFLRKWMSSKIIPFKNCKGGGTVYGITIGDNAIVGACTLVKKDIPDGATALGVPCRIVARLPHEELEVL